MDFSKLIASSRAKPALDVALAIWVACWVGLGIATGVEVESLTSLSSTVVREGQAVRRVASSISGLSSLPIVGGSVRADSREAEIAGGAAIRGGQSSTGTIEALGILLTIAVSVLPSAAILGLYLPLRGRLGERQRPYEQTGSEGS